MANPVLYEVRDRVATVTINRPEQRNALSPAALDGLRAAFARAGSDDEVGAVVLTGAGDRAFCSGADMSGGSAGAFTDPKSYDAYLVRAGFPELYSALHACPRPIVGKVRGYCLAGGFGLALACDLIVAASSASFGTPEVRRGLFPMVIFAEISRNLGLKRAMELVLLGDRIDGETALGWGFVNSVVPDAELDLRVDEMASRLASYSPAILGLGKQACHTAAEMTYPQALQFLRSQLSINLLTEDSAEGLAAFREKRDPVWKGR